MPTAVKRIKKGDTVKIISGVNKGVTAKVEAVLTKKNAVLLEGVGKTHRHVRANAYSAAGTIKEIHVPVALSKVALVVEEKTGKTSRVGYVKNADGSATRVARQLNSKEIK